MKKYFTHSKMDNSNKNILFFKSQESEIEQAYLKFA